MKARSIRQALLLWTMGALALGAALLIAGSWWLLRHEMGEVFEDNLKQVALAVAHHAQGQPGTPPRLAQPLPRPFEEHGKFEFVTAAWALDGHLLYTSDPSVQLPFRSRSGLTRVSASGEPWHLYTIVLEDRIVQSAQRASERELLARETAGELVGPTVALLALIAALLAWALHRGLRPLSAAAGQVAARSVEALSPIPLQEHPRELHPLVAAINGLMARLGGALQSQRRLVADAAHELRTPITALRLQLQLLERAEERSQRDAALAELRAGMLRAQHLVEQLLELSRLGPEAPALQARPVALGELVRSRVAFFSARAEQLGIDLGAEPRGEPIVAGDPAQLTTLLDNLLENALRHTPRGGRVDAGARIEGGVPLLWVADDGPGIPPAERDRVFDRFYRGSSAAAGGAGLGLAIVQAVAQRHGASVQLHDAAGGGLLVTVRFAPAPTGTAAAGPAPDPALPSARP